MTTESLVQPGSVATLPGHEMHGIPGAQEGLVSGLSGGSRGPDIAKKLQSAPVAHEAIRIATQVSVEPPSHLPVINPLTGQAEPTFSLDEFTDPRKQPEIQAAQATANGGVMSTGETVNNANGAKPPEALTQAQLDRQGELLQLQTEGKASAAQQAELIRLNKQQEEFDGLQQQQMEQGKAVSDALNAGRHTDADGKEFTQAQLDLADRYRAEQKAQPQAVEAPTAKPTSFAERASDVANKRNAYDRAIAGGQFAPDKSESTPRPTDPILGIQQGRPLNSAEQTAYDTHMQGIEGKMAEGKLLTKQEAADYRGHLERQEAQIDTETHSEAVGLGAEINKELSDPKNTKGEMTTETKRRFVAFVDSLTGGAYSKNALFAEALGLNLLDDEGKARVAEKLQKLAEKMTPEIAQQINERLQLLAQLEVQVYSLRAQRDENALSARDVKQFIKDNYADYDPQDDPDSLTDQIAMEKRQKWIQTLSMLNAYKAAIGAAEASHVVLLQEAGQVRVDLYKKLGINKGERFIGMVVRRLGNMAERKATDALISSQYDEIEDKVNVSAAAHTNHRPPDLSGLKP